MFLNSRSVSDETRVLLLLFKTFHAHSTIIQLYFIHPISVNVAHFYCRGSWHIEQIDYATAFFTEEVYVRTDVTVVAYAMVVYCQHLRCPMLGKQPKRVIKRGAT